MNWRRYLRSRRTLGVASAAAMAGILAFTCIGHKPYRVTVGDANLRPIRTSIAQLSQDNDEYRKLVESSATELHGNQFTLHFIEFDDSGWLWNRAQSDQVLERIKIDAAPRGAVILTYVHGWKHNASVCDSNVACFRDVLRYLSQAERDLYGVNRREIIGVYMGWRGGITTLPLVKELSFWNRKEAAHAIGNGEAIEVLSRLNVIYKDLAIEGGRHAARTRLVTVGHSMGGAVVFSAIAGAMKDRVVTQMPSVASADFSGPIDGFGDLVVLVNPAFEASIYRSIAERSQASNFSSKQTPLLITVGSEKDRANQIAFPIGRRLSALFQSLRDDEQRQATRTSLANYDRYVTHRLNAVLPGVAAKTGETPTCGCPTPLPSWEEMKRAVASRCKRVSEVIDLHFAAGGCFGSAELKQERSVHPDNPFMVIRASNEVVAEHNGIFNPTFTDFLVSFVAAAERKKTSVFAAAMTMPVPALRSSTATPVDPATIIRQQAESRRSTTVPKPSTGLGERWIPTTTAMPPSPYNINDLTERIPRISPGPTTVLSSWSSDRTATPPATPAPVYVVRDVSDAMFDEAVLKAPKSVVVVFWAPWAAPCVSFNQTVKETAPSLSGRVDFYLMNLDSSARTAKRYGVESVPTSLMFREGKLVDRTEGALPRDLLERFVQRNITGGPAG